MKFLKYINMLVLFLVINQNLLAGSLKNPFRSEESFEDIMKDLGLNITPEPFLGTQDRGRIYPCIFSSESYNNEYSSWLGKRKHEPEENTPNKKVRYNESEPELETIHLLKEYCDKIENKIKELNIEPKEVLVCLDLDKVSVKDGTNEPLENENTKEAYKDLIGKGYSVLMLTARNDGKKQYTSGRQELIKIQSDLHEKICDNSVCFLGLDKNEYEVDTRYGQQFGYFIGGVFYAGQCKDEMLAKILEDLGETKRKKFNDEKFVYKALFMVDDQRDYLTPFLQNVDLKKSFEEKVFVYLFK